MQIKMMKNKKGMELSINFIVMLILAIAVFAGGLVFASKFFGHAQKVRGSLDAQTEKQIEKLLDSGSPVVLPISTKDINKNKFGTFGVGVLADYNGEYVLSVEYSGDAFKKDKTRITADAGSWLQVPMTNQELEKNEKGTFMIGVTVPKDAERGTYLFNVAVDYMGDPSATPPVQPIQPYDNPLQMIVRVP